MLAGYRDIGDPNLALVSTADLHALFGSVLDDHDTLLLLAGALQDQVVPRRLVHPDHLLREARIFTIDLHIAWEFGLADLALKLGEVVVLGAADHFLLDLDADPLGEAVEVHRATGAVALAGVEQEVVLLVVVVEADLAGVALDGGVVVELQHVFVEKSLRVLQRLLYLPHSIRTLAHVVLDPAQLQRHSGHCIGGVLPSL
jgi:hypothetical protein